MTRRYAFDAVVLSNFALADGLDVLQRRYAGRGVVPAEVWDEIAAGIARGLSALQRVDDLLPDKTFSLVSLTARSTSVTASCGRASAAAKPPASPGHRHERQRSSRMTGGRGWPAEPQDCRLPAPSAFWLRPSETAP